jgi:hypothetical protein
MHDFTFLLFYSLTTSHSPQYPSPIWKASRNKEHLHSKARQKQFFFFFFVSQNQSSGRKALRIYRQPIYRLNIRDQVSHERNMMREMMNRWVCEKRSIYFGAAEFSVDHNRKDHALWFNLMGSSNNRHWTNTEHETSLLIPVVHTLNPLWCILERWAENTST